MATHKSHCRDCGRFLDPKTGQLCPNTKGLNQQVDSKKCRFKAGRPYQPLFRGALVQDVPFDAEEPAAWAFWFGPQECLLLTWSTDHNQYGHFDCYLQELNDQGVVEKDFRPGKPAPAFCGEIAVKGAGGNDLWASFGYEDDDSRDSEGSIINKPRAVQLRPRRKD